MHVCVHPYSHDDSVAHLCLAAVDKGASRKIRIGAHSRTLRVQATNKSELHRSRTSICLCFTGHYVTHVITLFEGGSRNSEGDVLLHQLCHWNVRLAPSRLHESVLWVLSAS